MSACNRVASYLLGLAAIFAWTTAIAAVGTTTYGPFSVNCTSSGQLCNNTFSQSISTTSTLQVQYTASTGHCSNVRAHILVDGVEKAVTSFLPPGQSSGFFNVGPVSAGSHTVALQGEGTVGGCNVGVLANWGGTMDVMADIALAASGTSAIPTLDTSMLVLLSLLIVAAMAFTSRRG